MSAPHQSPHQKAIGDALQFACPDKAHARAAVDAVFYRLTDPDRDMLEAGAAELRRALLPGTTNAHARNLAAAIWRAMLEAAR